MKLEKTYKISSFIIVCILINYAGRVISEKLVLPVWLDSVGTVLAAYVFGPVCGAVTGATANILYSMHYKTAIFYGLVNIAVGITAGICARKGFLKNIFGMMSVAFLVAAISAIISAPLNYILADGSTGNVWGDGVAGLLAEMGLKKPYSFIAGEFYLDFLDKVISMLLLFLIVKAFHRIKDDTRRKSKKAYILVFLFMMVNGTVHAEERTGSGYDFHKYVQTVYNGENGLACGTANDIVQTKDGVLWIGTNGGLYRYSGNNFQWMDSFESVKNVNCLYTDEAGRLWIGTNDNGLSICINKNISNVLNQKNGLPSNSVYCITENTEGYYYVGTEDSLVIMTLSGGMGVYDTIPGIVCADSISADHKGNVAAVTDEGNLYIVRGKKITTEQKFQKDGEVYNCCAFDNTGKLYAGTSGNKIIVYKLEAGGLKKISSIECGSLRGINSLYFTEDGVLFACADNGAGYLCNNNSLCPIDTNGFNSSIGSMLFDYQGNLWFTSSRSGLLRLCPSVFTEIYKEEGLHENTVNTIVKWHGCLYIGTDRGICTGNGSNAGKITDYLIQKFRGTAIRCMITDSKGDLWICTSKGIFEISKELEIKKYVSKAGRTRNKFNCAIETKDGAVAAAGDSGIIFIKDGRIYNTISGTAGLGSAEVLSLYEREDGTLLAGTDGNGIVILKNGRVTETLKQEDGLSSDVIHRIVPDSDSGLFIVTGNGLCYTDGESRTRILDNFPYYNNYDIVLGKQDELFVLSSAGIYIVDKDQLLCGDEVKYELLDFSKGLKINLTPGAWNYIDEEGSLYLSGNTGVVSINLEKYNINTRSYHMLFTEAEADGVICPVEKGETIIIPRGVKKFEIKPEIVNYSVNNPDISVYLEGFDKNPKIIPQSMLSSIVYTNLPSGGYTFHLAVLDSRTGSIIAENKYQIMKEKEIYDNWWFKLYVAIESAIIISYLTWMFVRTQIQKTLRIQKMELEWAKNQLQMGNETILTIAQAVDAKDEKTSKHSARVSEYSVMIAKKLGYSNEECEELRKIAMLHDIGKIGIPDQVLNKPGRLTDDEYEIMKSHVARGAEILKNFTLIDNVADGALYHHERYDGKGYIHGLKGEEIPLNARIIGIADAFDAMTANRVYRKKLDFGHVLEELEKGSGTQFDPGLVKIMLGLIEDGIIDVKQIYKTEDIEEE